MEVLLQTKNITKYYGPVKVLENIDFDLYKGEIHALVGKNGAGKSTFVKIIAGDIKEYGGEIFLEGKKLDKFNPIQARDLQISIVHQAKELVPSLDAVENIFLGNELLTKWGTLDRITMRQKAVKILNELNVKINLSIPVEKLSVSQQQLVSIAKALSRKNKVLIIDEGSASLDNEKISELFRILRRLKQMGLGIIYISHLLDNVMQISDRITVLRNGRRIVTRKINEIDIQELVSFVAGEKEDEEGTKREPIREKTGKRIKEERVLIIKDLRWEGSNNKNSFYLKRGEILGITGPVGAGKSELMRCVFGAKLKEEGEVSLNKKGKHKVVNIDSPLKAVKLGIGFVPEDRLSEGLVICRSVEENISLPFLKLGVRFICKNRLLKNKANKLIEMLGIVTDSVDQRIEYLSGGNQQKVVIAKWIGGSSSILLLDEPFKGIDIGAKRDIGKLIRNLASKGVSIIVNSTEFSDLIGLVDRLLIMVNHRITKELLSQEINKKRILEYYLFKTTQNFRNSSQ